jgi:hypothetical protein
MEERYELPELQLGAQLTLVQPVLPRQRLHYQNSLHRTCQ